MNSPPDAVVLDLNLDPTQHGGLELLRMLRRQTNKIPIIAISDEKDVSNIRTLWSAYEEEVVTEDQEEVELEPDVVLFRTDLIQNKRGLTLALSEILWKVGRVSNDQAVLITHGTDTMAWCFAYLRYALKDLTCNIAITGSQIPLEGYFSISDALGNLKTAVYLLNQLRPGMLFCVFNDGQAVYSSRLQKIRKWDRDAFDGKIVATAGPETCDLTSQEWCYIPYVDQKLKLLHLIRTGGTIEAKRDAYGGLTSTGDYVPQYLYAQLSAYFVNIHQIDLFRLDSSNMSLEHWGEIAAQIEKIGAARCDTGFSKDVKAVFANPMMTTNDYKLQFDAAPDGIVLLGFGAGNANTQEASGRSPLPNIREATKSGKLVVISSQVPLESYDIDYNAGRQLLIAGGIPSGDLPLAEAQMKLSYLLGHPSQVEDAAKRYGLTPRQLFLGCFLAGMKMRKQANQAWYLSLLREQGTPVRILPEDPFVSLPFAEALERVIDSLVPRKNQ